MTMKKIFNKTFLLFQVFFALSVLHCMSSFSFANNILTFINNSKSNVFLSMRFLDSKNAAWVTRGWISITAAQEKVIPIQTTEEIIYYFVLDRKGTEWGGTQNDKDDRLLWIMDKNFRALGNAKPAGKKQRKVWFDSLTPEDDGSFVIEIVD